MKKNGQSTLHLLPLVGFLFFMPFFPLAQDIHFSQYNHSPLTLNPSQTGNFEGDWRLSGNYRRQWGQIGKPLATFALAYDRQFYIFNNRFSGGLQVVNDEAGAFRITQQRILLSLAHHFRIRYHRIHFGIQGGVVQKGTGTQGMAFPDQYDIDRGSFNTALATGDQNLGNSIRYGDLHAGIGWSRPFRGFTPEVGIALFHLNRPDENFTGQAYYLPIREVFHGRVTVPLSPKVFLTPGFLYMSQRKSRDLILGSEVNYRWAKNAMKVRYVFAGAALREGLTRNWDAFIFTGGIQSRRWRSAVSYDVTVSRLRLANSYQGAWELSLIYTGLSSVLNKRAVPCDRF